MRGLIVALLLAGAAGPALAAPDDDRERLGFRGPRAERSEAQGDRPSRSELRIERSDRSDARPDRPPRDVQFRRDAPGFERSSDAPRSGFDRPQRIDASPADDAGRRFVRTPRGFEDQRIETPGERAQRRGAGDTVRDWRSRERSLEDSPSTIEERNLRRAPRVGEQSGGAGDGLVQQRRSLPRVFEPGERRVSRTPRFGTEPPPPATTFSRAARPEHRWSHDWRRDRRYDWREWRRRHRWRFDLGFYYDPFGWDYFRYRTGWRLWPHYYRSSYWLHDPWMYRLPPAYGPYRWIRYHDDALLVNIYTGEVVDVVYDFFW